eukprot:734617-Pelagomonas_calceolata.AAC.1
MGAASGLERQEDVQMKGAQGVWHCHLGYESAHGWCGFRGGADLHKQGVSGKATGASNHWLFQY